jgi:hypothetical protein
MKSDNEWCIRKDLEGSGSGIILRCYPSILLGETEAKHEKPQSVFRPRF